MHGATNSNQRTTRIILKENISDIEWFASPRDIWKLYKWMDDKGDKNFRKVIGLNAPFIKLANNKRWAYAGYKGGSEPGVLEMAYLLENKKGKRYCFYMGQNILDKPVNQEVFFALVKGVLKFLEGSPQK